MGNRKTTDDEETTRIKNDFAERLRYYRERSERYHVQARLAEALGIDPATYNTYEKNNVMPRIPVLLNICSLLDIRMDDLFHKPDGENKDTYTLREKADIEETMDHILGENETYQRIENGNLMIDHRVMGQVIIGEKAVRQALNAAKQDYFTSLGKQLRELLDSQEIAFDNAQEVEWQKEMAEQLGFDFSWCRKVYEDLVFLGVQACFNPHDQKVTIKVMERYAFFVRRLRTYSMSDLFYAAYFLEIDPFAIVEAYLQRIGYDTNKNFSGDIAFLYEDIAYLIYNYSPYQGFSLTGFHFENSDPHQDLIQRVEKHIGSRDQVISRYHINVPKDNDIAKKIEKHYLQYLGVKEDIISAYMDNKFGTGLLRKIYVFTCGDKTNTIIRLCNSLR